MAKLVVRHDVDPAIGVVLTEVLPGTAGVAQGWYGACTECGWRLHRWMQGLAVEDAQAHVDRHDAVVIGIDPSSVVGTAPVQVGRARFGPGPY
jgi:hypothetical protein